MADPDETRTELREAKRREETDKERQTKELPEQLGVWIVELDQLDQ